MVCSCSSWSDGGKLSHHTHCFGMTRPAMVHETLTFSVIGAFFEVYNTLGFGFQNGGGDGFVRWVGSRRIVPVPIQPPSRNERE